MYDNSSRVIEVDINEILPNRFQPRIQFDEEEILELSDSIKEHGVIQPLVVRTIGDKYEIIAGERRYKASVLAGKETVPVIVKNLNDKDSAEIALIENIQRKNLTPIEEALSYKKILDMGYMTQENLASKLGKSQPSVANKIRLLNLSDEVQEALLENKISERHARSLLKLSTTQQQNEMLNRIINERLTVRRTDEEIEKLKNTTSSELDSDGKEIIEKGEIEMNNNVFGIPNVPQAPQNFDIFGTNNVQSTPVMEPQVANIQVEPEIQTSQNFDIFGSTPQPVVEPITPSIETVQPIMPNLPQMGEFQFDANAPVMPSQTNIQPQIPVMNDVSLQPVVEPITPSIETVQPIMPNLPQMGEFQFDANAPVMPQTSSQPETSITNNVVSQSVIEPTISTVENIPQTAPIIEQPIVDNNIQITQPTENLFGFGDNNINSTSLESQQNVQEMPTLPEFKMPEPIIITDYSKQYDPVMPQTIETITPTVDFKEVINAIRECSSKIEQYGFKIDVEEFDLTNLYQVIFKIEK